MRNEKRSSQIGADSGSVVKVVIFLAAVVMALILLAVGVSILLGRQKNDPQKDGSAVKEQFSDIISKGDDIFEDELLSLPELSIEEAFPLYSVKDTYYQQCDVCLYDASGTELKRQKQVIRSGDKYNIKTFEEGALIETIIFDGEKALIIDEETDTKKIFVPNEDVSIFDLAALPDHERILAILKEHDAKKESGESPLTRYNYRILSSKVLNMLALVLNYKEASATENYYYYLDYGMIYHCETTVATPLGRTPSYSMTTTAFSPEISHLLTDDIFKIEE